VDAVRITQNHATACKLENAIVEAIANVWIVEIQAVEHTANFFCLIIVPKSFSSLVIMQ
jgi:hypothetical protein